jgi:hypothetical protein
MDLWKEKWGEEMDFFLATMLSLAFVFSGCASYKYTTGVNPYGEGYVVLRNGTVIPEYTIGKDNKAPQDLELAEERFKSRRTKVEYYYKKMDIIYSQLSAFVTYPAALVGMIGGVFKLPFILASDYRYEHNPEYRKKVDAKELERRIRDAKERKSQEDKLKNFIKQELEEESLLKGN